MKAYEFVTEVDKEGTILLPAAIKQLIPEQTTVRVLLLIDDAKDKTFQSADSDILSQDYSYLLNKQGPVYDDF